MKYLSILLHCYQPPWQEKEILEQIIAECYQPLFDSILWHPKAIFTVSINYSLLELFEKYNHRELIKSIRRSANLGRIELTGSGAFHPILPLLPESECQRQIILNERGIKRTLGQYLKNGFFPPEMAFNPGLAQIVKEAGYRWLITDDLPFVCQYKYSPYNFIPLTNGLPILLRSRFWSCRLAFKEFSSGWEFVNHLQFGLNQWFDERDGYLILALDAETFGHHHHGYLNFLEEIWEALHYQSNWRLITVSEILSHFPTKVMEVPAGSWSTSGEDFRRGMFFPLWWHPENCCQQLLWELIDVLLVNLGRNNLARKLMDRALNSCQFWWLSSGHWNPGNAFKTMPIYFQIINRLNLPGRTLEKIMKICRKLEKETGYPLQI